jgi:MoaA/NifB/PqqE/SkfB family radical SAM enzyme
MSETACSLLWNHLASHPNGSVSMCCQNDFSNSDSFARTNGKMLFLGKSTLDEIRNSESFKQARLTMLAGNEPAACKRCYETERSGGRSKRQLENHLFNWQEENAFTYIDGSIDSPLQFIELRLGNTCNLACVTCNSVSSSKWHKDEQFLSKKIEWFNTFENSKQTRWFESEEFYRNLADISKHVQKIYINGGEPLLIKQHKVLLNKLIEMGVAKNIQLEYSINLTITDLEFIELWSKFKYVVVQLSIDATGELNDWIRYGSKFSEIQNNLEWFIANKPHNTYYMVCQTVSAINACKIEEMQEFLAEYELDMHVNPVYSPDYFSAAALTEAEKIKIRKLLARNKNEHIKSTMNAWLDNNVSSFEIRDKLNQVVNALNETRTVQYPKHLGDIVISK